MSDRLTGRLISPPARATARKRADTRAETTDETNAQRNGDPPRPRRRALTDAEREAIHAAIDALPPMTDEQIEAIAEVIIAARERRRHTRQTSRGPPLPPGADTLAGQRPRRGPLASHYEMQLMKNLLECAESHIHTLRPGARGTEGADAAGSEP